MQVGHVELPVRDALRSARFYTEVLGFTLEANQADRFVWLTSGQLTLLLRPGFDGAPENDLSAVNLVLYTDDVPGARARLEDADVAWSERANCLHFRDPDGHWLQIVDPHEDHSG